MGGVHVETGPPLGVGETSNILDDSVGQGSLEKQNQVHVCVCLYIYKCICTYTHTHLYIYTYVHIYVCVHMCVCMYKEIYHEGLAHVIFGGRHIPSSAGPVRPAIQ